MRSVKQRVLAALLTAVMLGTYVMPAYAADATVSADPTAGETIVKEDTTVAEKEETVVPGEETEVQPEEKPEAAPEADPTAEPELNPAEQPEEAPVEEEPAEEEPVAEEPAEKPVDEPVEETVNQLEVVEVTDDSVALFAEGHVALDKAPMKSSAKASSEEAAGSNSWGDGPAAWAFDNDITTAWHSAYTGQQLPQNIEWNLGNNGETFVVSGLHYQMKNNGNGGNGRWEKITIEAFVKDQQVWNGVATLPSGNCNIDFGTTVVADAMKVTVLESMGNVESDVNKFACAGELTVYGEKPETVKEEYVYVPMLDKTAMQASATANSQENEGDNPYNDGPASWAFDGKVDKGWHTKYTGGQEPGPHTIQWNLTSDGSAVSVGRLEYVMKNSTSSGNGLWQKIQIEATVNGQPQIVYDGDVTLGDGNKAMIEFTNAPVNATKLKVTIKQGQGNFASAGEITVYQAKSKIELDPQPLPNTQKYQQIPQAEIAKNEISASSYRETSDTTGDGPAAWAFDGKTDTAWHVNYSADLRNKHESIQWNLGGVKLIGQIGYIRRDNHDNHGNGRWKTVVVSGQKDDGSWVDLRKVIIQESQMENNGDEVLIRFTPAKVQALKVTVTDSYNAGEQKFAQAGEIKTYEVVDKETYTLSVNPETATAKEGDTFQLSATFVDDKTGTEVENLTYNWSVQGGNLTVEGNGKNATVTANSAGEGVVRVEVLYNDALYAGTCDVTVQKKDVDSVIAINGKDYKVKSLEEAVNKAGKGEINSIVFKSGVIRKEDFAFISANAERFDYELKTFRIEDAVVPMSLYNNAIPMNAFKLNGSGSVGLTHVYLGKNIKGIEGSAFYLCKELVSFEAPGVEFLKTNALGGLKSLETLELPALKELNNNCIKDAYGVKSIKLPSVTTLGQDAFKTFSKLTDVTLGETIPHIEYRAPLNLASTPKENGVSLHVPKSALDAYKQSGYFENGKWAGLTLVEKELATVTFDVDGIQTTVQVELGEKLGAKLPADPTKEGFTFAGWVDQNGNAVTADTVVNGNLTVTAKWTENEKPVDPTPTPDKPVDPTPTPDKPVDPTPTPEKPVDPDKPVEPTPTPESTAKPAEPSNPTTPSAPAQGNAAKAGDTTYLFGWMVLAGVMAAGAVWTYRKQRCNK